MRNSKMIALCLATSLGLAGGTAWSAPNPVASYSFNNVLTSSVAGAASLTVTDPHATSGFGTDTVFGSSHSVFNFVGTSDNAGQAGLSLSSVGLLTSSSVYSMELIFKFTERANGWRRIVDVQHRTSDNGFYVDPGNNLNVFPVGGGSPFTNNVYHDVFLVNNNGQVSFYLDGSAQATVTAPFMAVDSSNLINLFLDNVLAGGQNEYSSGSIALFQLYNEALGAANIPVVPVLPGAPPVAGIPEPQTYAMLLAGMGALAVITRRRKHES